MVTRPIGIILARGGSKGIRLKNIVPFVGFPLITWSIAQLKQAGVSRVVVSTDHDEIAKVAEEWGAEVIRRPDNLSTDTASGDLALVHAVETLGLKMNDTVLLAQATSPLRKPEHFSEALRYFAKENCDSLFSAVEIPDLCVWSASPSLRSITYDYQRRINRQELQGLLVENGSFYVFTAGTLLSTKNRLGGKIKYYKMPAWTLHEIDEPADLELCATIMSHYADEIVSTDAIRQNQTRKLPR